MSPDAIVREARRKGLEMIAVCDHNSARNARPVVAAAARLVVAERRGPRLVVLPGIEITTAEEVHLLGLFPACEAAEAVSAEVACALPPALGGARRFGQQRLFDLEGRPLGEEELPLDAATRLTLDAAVALVRRHGGLPIPAHVDRPAHGLFAQLGVFPEGLEVEALEVTPRLERSPFAGAVAALGLPHLRCSDAHALEEIAACMTVFELEAAELGEVRLGLRREGGRGCWHA